jgi:hypothetical protein
VRAAVADGARERVLEEVELGLPADERRARAENPRRALERIHETPGTKRSLEALELERAGVLDDEAPGRQPVGRRTDEDLTRPCRLLETCSQVDGLSRRECRLGALDDQLAGLDPYPRLQAELAHGVAYRKRGARSPVSVVLVRLDDSERGEDGIPRELLDDPAVLPDAVGGGLEEPIHSAPDHLGVCARDELRRADEIDEQDGGELSFHT